MTEVYNLLTAANGRVLQYLTVRISLMAEGNNFTSLAEVIQTTTVDTGTDGRWDADLIPNASYEREGTWYRVDQRDGLLDDEYVHNIIVPESGGPYWIRDLLTVAPEPGEPFPPVPAHALTDHTDVDTAGATAGHVLKFNGTAWVPDVDQSGGGGGGGSYEHFQDLQATEVLVAHGLGFRPAGVRLFAADWATEYDEFSVTHHDALSLTVRTDQPFRGYVTVS